jgi:hypothetical protein
MSCEYEISTRIILQKNVRKRRHDIRHNDIQHDDTQHNDTQPNNKKMGHSP